jgi:acetoin utilization protein AcuB
MHVETMMQSPMVTATPEMSLAAVHRLMRQHHIRHVPVVSGKRLVGMITDRDIRTAMPSPATTYTKGEIAYQMDTTPVKACMTTPVVWIRPDVDMAQAARLLLEHTFGCLPVVDNGNLVGVVTEIDCVGAFLISTQVSPT